MTCDLVPALARQTKRMPCPGASHTNASTESLVESQVESQVLKSIKVVFKTGHEEVRDGLIGGSLMLSRVNKEQGTLFRIQEDLTMNQQKLYRNAWVEAGKRSKSGDEEEWTVVGPKSQPRLLLKRRLDEGKRTSRVERKELEKKKLAEVPPTALQNNLVMRAANRAQEIQDAEDAEREERDAVGDGVGCNVHDKDINDYQVARSRRADDEIVSRL
jgi:hypothetical protein